MIGREPMMNRSRVSIRLLPSVLLVTLLPCLCLVAQDTTEITVDSVAVLPAPDRPVRPEIVPLLTSYPDYAPLYAVRSLLVPTGSFAELIRGRGRLRALTTSQPPFPASFSSGTSGPGAVPILIDGVRAPTADGRPLGPIYVPIFRVGDVEFLRGVDASLYGGADAHAGLHVLPQTFDVQGSYLRFGYTGAPGDVSRVAVLFARNLDPQTGLSFNFRRTPGTDLETGAQGSVIGGDLTIDHYPDRSTRISATAELHELDRDASGGLGDGGNPVYLGLDEEGRRRGVRLSWTSLGALDRHASLDDSTMIDTVSVDPGLLGSIRFTDPRASLSSRPDRSLRQLSLFYQHDGRYLYGLPAGPSARVEDIVGVAGTLVAYVGDDLYLRSHLHGSLGNGRVGRVHAGGLLGFAPGEVSFEGGAVLTGVDSLWRPALLAAVRGGDRTLGWSLDARFYPGVASDADPRVFDPIIDTAGPIGLVSRWMIEGRVRYLTDRHLLDLDGGLRGIDGPGAQSGTAFDVGAFLSTPAGPFTLSGSARSGGVSTVDDLYPLFSGEGELGYAFDLFRGALDLYAGLRGEFATASGGYRYDPVLDLWFSNPQDRETTTQYNPWFSAIATARIGSAFFSFELVNLLNVEYWTIRRRPNTGFGLRFGLTWALID